MSMSASKTSDSVPGVTTATVRAMKSTTSAERASSTRWPSGELSSMETMARPLRPIAGETCTSPSPAGASVPRISRSRPKVHTRLPSEVTNVIATANGSEAA